MVPEAPLGVTVVIPTYNREALVERALDSVLGQSRPPDAVIVVDDGSTDHTLDRLAAYGDAITVLAQANAGASAARNAGVARCGTPWVAFCDSDDHWAPDHLERLLEAVAATGGEAGLYFDDIRIDDLDGGGTFFEIAGVKLGTGHQFVPPVAPWLLGSLQPMLLQSSLVRTAVWRDLGGLAVELRVRHDTHLFFRVGFVHPICAVAGVGGHLSADAASDERLTGAGGQRSASFWDETLWMYTDLLAAAPDDSTRTAMRQRLAGAEVKVATVRMHEGRLREGLMHLGRAVRIAPGEVMRLIGLGLRRRAARQGRNDARIPR